MFSKTALAAAAILSMSLVDAHMLMTNPVPYSKDSLDNSPILADGSNFPCKDTDYTVSTENTLAKGQAHTMEFEGSATHGGGSCQISITSDRAPTRDTQWSVIKSIEGGCMDPNEGADNQGDNAGMKSSFAPSFTIPDSFEDGKYTLAWTWFNRLGNREMYMNCAPITITGGSAAKRSDETAVEEKSDVAVIEKRAEEFPPLFIANINGCKTPEPESIRFPNPGSEVESFNEGHLIADASGVCTEGTSPTWGDAGYSSGGGSAPEPTSAGGSGGSIPTSEPVAATPTVPTAPTGSVSVGGAVGVAPQPTITQPAPVVPAPSSTFVSVPAAPTAAPTSSPSTSTEGALSGACTDEGAWNCVGGYSFQRCASGTWTEVQALSGGTECEAGQNKNFAVKAIQVKSRMLKEKRRRNVHGHAHA
ncbi:lytic polysaccharide monooxygenase AA11 family protein [Aspergillus undulatus]|uniref:lytic polysaccharide monooxygenase AA11 family protein n=1 Tax=Aspergillus undulatus TaxID=1810928 RepID=UPI003CCDB1B3